MRFIGFCLEAIFIGIGNFILFFGQFFFDCLKAQISRNDLRLFLNQSNDSNDDFLT